MEKDIFYYLAENSRLNKDIAILKTKYKSLSRAFDNQCDEIDHLNDVINQLRATIHRLENDESYIAMADIINIVENYQNKEV